MTRDYLSVDDLDSAELDAVLELAGRMKADRSLYATALTGKAVALIFEKSSTRTRCAFEVAAFDQGASVTYLGPSGSQIGHKETMKDTARLGELLTRG